MRYLSVCSGIEAATVAWAPLGWTPVAFAEIEPFPCAVLAHHYPDVPNVGDMTKIDGREYRGTVNLLVGGTPCQDFSVAGKRAGLSGERSGLALDFIRLAREIAPRWLLWENVPGCLSTNAGIDFGSFAQALADCGYHLAYRILDAQFFGVPQRRRRVFVVGYLGDWRPAVAVLFEPHGLRRDTPPRRKTGQDITKAITRSLGAGGADDNRAQGGFYVPEIVNQAMSCKWSRGTSGPAGDEHHNLICPPLTTRPYGDNDAQQEKLVVSQYGGITGSLTLRHDSSPCADRGMTVVAIHPHCIGRGPDAGPQGKEYLEDGSVYTIDTKAPQAVAFAQNQIGEVRTGDMCGTLNRNSNASGRNTPMVFTETAPTIGSSGPPYSRTGNSRIEAEAVAATGYGVRRLTPRECERLQGFPDDYTAISWRGRPAEECPDGPRYKALGNSMAVPVMRWIGERIQKYGNPA